MVIGMMMWCDNDYIMIWYDILYWWFIIIWCFESYYNDGWSLMSYKLLSICISISQFIIFRYDAIYIMFFYDATDNCNDDVVVVDVVVVDDDDDICPMSIAIMLLIMMVIIIPYYYFVDLFHLS